ncbi:MAG: questin oxidase family protein, partial [Mycobacterium sp.]
YRHRMEHHDPPAPGFALDPADESSWRPALGAFDRAGDWEVLFRRQLSEHPWPDVVTEWWPRLLPGLFGRLTHGLIRTAHAVRSVAGAGEPNPIQLGELARGLAFWAAGYTALPGRSHLTGSATVAGAVAALPRRATDDSQGSPGLGSHPGYLSGLDALAPGKADELLSDMTTTFAGVYLAHPEVAPVPLVHGVTAPAAIWLVLPYLPERLRLATVAVMWQSHLALLLRFTSSTAGENDIARSASETETPPVAGLIARALDHGDEHVIKFTEAVLREHALRPDARFLPAVVAAQHRIPRYP